jgi:hypothetical protein
VKKFLTFDLTDWFILLFVVTAGVYLWKHPSDLNYTTFCSLAVLWHGIRVYDQKRADIQ